MNPHRRHEAIALLPAERAAQQAALHPPKARNSWMGHRDSDGAARSLQSQKGGVIPGQAGRMVKPLELLGIESEETRLADTDAISGNVPRE